MYSISEVLIISNAEYKRVSPRDIFANAKEFNRCNISPIGAGFAGCHSDIDSSFLG